jgi:putative copper export protein
VWGWVHSIHILCAALWIGGLFADRVLVAPLVQRLDPREQPSAILRVLKVSSAVGWASITFLTITGLALTFRWVPIERYESPYGRFFLAKLAVVMVLFLVFVMFYSGRQQQLKAALAQGATDGTVVAQEAIAGHLRRLGLYTAIDLVLAVAVVVLIELAIYA